MGVSKLLADNDEDDNYDIEKLEQTIIDGGNIVKSVQKDVGGEYTDDLEKFARRIGIDQTASKKSPVSNIFNSSQPSKPSVDFGLTNFRSDDADDAEDEDDADDADDIIHRYSTPQNAEPVRLQQQLRNVASSNYDSFSQPQQAASSSYSQSQPQQPYSSGHNSSKSPWQAPPSGDVFNDMTNEERRQQHINKVLEEIPVQHDDDQTLFQEQDEEEELAHDLEQLDNLRSGLENEGVDLSRITVITPEHSKKERKAVLRVLQLKNDRLRYVDVFNEIVLAGAYGLEKLFDGKKEWFGSKPDLIGYPETVKMKLRRMQYSTSNFVGEVMKDYSISHGWRILFELIPSIFLYSRDRKVKSNDNMVNDERYRDAMSGMADVQ